ncbi:hypothetical protein AB0J52_35955, partial [Spirillospora sp. NPDC049652]
AEVLTRAALGALRQLRPLDAGAEGNPQIVVPHVDRHWGVLSKFDSALVSSADGTKVAWYRRDPDRFRRIMTRASALHARLGREWPELAVQYRAALPELTAPETWRRTFEANPASATPAAPPAADG